MSEVAIPHGWPDGETRPLPFGSVLAFLNSGTTGGSGIVTVGALDIGAWQSLALAVDVGGAAVTIDIDWEFLGSATVAPATRIVHPGDGSVVLVPSWGHRVSGLTMTTTASQPISYAIGGSNLESPRLPVLRTYLIGDDTGSQEIPLYTVYTGRPAAIVRLHFDLLLQPDPADNASARQWADLVYVRADHPDGSSTIVGAFDDIERMLAEGPTAPVFNGSSFYSGVATFDVDIGDDGTGTFVCQRAQPIDPGPFAPGTTLTLVHVLGGRPKTPRGTGWWTAKAPLASDAMSNISLTVSEALT